MQTIQEYIKNKAKNDKNEKNTNYAELCRTLQPVFRKIKSYIK